MSGEDLIVCVDREESEALLEERGARRFDVTAGDGDLERWVRRGEEFAASLPAK